MLRTHIINYSKTRNVHVAYRKAGYSRKFYEAYLEEITHHKAAKEAFNQLNVKEISRVKELNLDYTEVMKQKKVAHAEYQYHTVRKEVRDYGIERKTVATILEIDIELENQKRQGKEKEKGTKRNTEGKMNRSRDQ